MCAPSPPATPDYVGAAQQQGQDNIAAARLSTALGRPNQITPWGSQTWTQGSGTATGAGSNPVSTTPTYGFGGTYNPDTGQIDYSGNAPSSSTGISPQDQWTSTITLDPAQQSLLDSQNRISQSMAGTAEQNLGRVGQAQANDFSTAGLPSLNGSPNANNVQGQINMNGVGNVAGADQFGAYKDKAYQDLMSRQNQQFDQQDKAMQQQLANQGIAPGSEAWNRAYQPLNQSRVDASNQSDLSANALQQSLINQANAAQQQQFGQAQNAGQFANSAAAQQFAQGLSGNQFGNQARQQGIQEQAYLRSLPLNELNALRTGSQVNAPTFSQYANTPVTPTPTLQGAQMQGQANQQAYQNASSSSNGLMSGLFGLGAASASTWAPLLFASDRRLKRDIIRIGVSPKGYPWYAFTYVNGQPAMGVMSDEVPASAVIKGADGFDRVDYSQV